MTLPLVVTDLAGLATVPAPPPLSTAVLTRLTLQDTIKHGFKSPQCSMGDKDRSSYGEAGQAGTGCIAVGQAMAVILALLTDG